MSSSSSLRTRLVSAFTRMGLLAAKSDGYAPRFNTVDPERLLAELAQFLGADPRQVKSDHAEYLALHEQAGHAALGDNKTLNLAEAFILFLLMRQYAPETIIEIGTQFGKSTRRIIDMKNHLGLDCPIHCYDVIDAVEHFTPAEATLHLKDLTQDFRAEVLERYAPGLIYLDAHPYYLLENAIGEVLAHPAPWVLAIHDCARGLCNPNMERDKADPEVWSKHGHWERHVLAELFDVDDPLAGKLDSRSTPTHSLKIFETRHGLAVIVPRTRKRAAGSGE